MSIWEAILLGIVQGLTEFLQISSSGHLILVPWLQDYTFLRENPDFNNTFDVALHICTLIGVVYYFRRELWAMLAGLVRDGTTLILTTQYLEEADTLADQIDSGWAEEIDHFEAQLQLRKKGKLDEKVVA